MDVFYTSFKYIFNIILLTIVLFIKFIDNDEALDFFSVQNSNYCKIKIFNHHSEDKIIIVSAIDNLIKGAAGQAVQCFNILENIEETVSLV